ncbi:uncharacterized protein RJT21DRAFT_14472 [Scheffersomyces amazonensis]|uniref:uncharacterized protein n=1 Tax=Scheffersomyces amazonensis TaxID=1078765 RepID=UPI00315CCA03
MSEVKKREHEDDNSDNDSHSNNGTSKLIKLDASQLKPSQTLYIKNLNDKINPRIVKHNLYLLFSTFGDVIQINNRKRGQAYIVFGDVDSATLALRSLQAEPFFNKPLAINYSINESKIITTLKRQQEAIESSDT